jgi:hypothetical protein
MVPELHEDEGPAGCCTRQRETVAGGGVWDNTSLFKGRYVTVQVMSASLVIPAILA